MSKRWRVVLTCCGRDNGCYLTETWEQAHAFRESYTSGPAVDPHGYSGNGYHGHQRSGVIEEVASPANATNCGSNETRHAFVVWFVCLSLLNFALDNGD